MDEARRLAVRAEGFRRLVCRFRAAWVWEARWARERSRRVRVRVRSFCVVRRVFSLVCMEASWAARARRVELIEEREAAV